jgi:hypothetical protein
MLWAHSITSYAGNTWLMYVESPNRTFVSSQRIFSIHTEVDSPAAAPWLAQGT